MVVEEVVRGWEDGGDGIGDGGGEVSEVTLRRWWGWWCAGGDNGGRGRRG